MKKVKEYFQSVFKEISNVAWLEKKELVTSSLSVLFIVFLFSIFFLLVDLSLSNLINFIL